MAFGRRRRPFDSSRELGRYLHAIGYGDPARRRDALFLLRYGRSAEFRSAELAGRAVLGCAGWHGVHRRERTAGSVLRAGTELHFYPQYGRWSAL